MKREAPWRTFMLARPDVLVACRWFRDADGFEYYSDDEVEEDFDDEGEGLADGM